MCSWIKRSYDKNFHEWKIIPSYLIRTIVCENFKFYPCIEPSIRSLKNVPNFYIGQTGQTACLNFFPWNFLVLYHQRFFPSFYGLTQTLKLTKRAFLSLALQVKTSILSVRFFTKMARLNHGITLNQNTTLKASWNIVGFN